MLPRSLAFYRKFTILISVISGILLLFLGLLYFMYEKHLLEREKYLDLQSIGKLKSTQIADWYEQNKREARLLSMGRQIPEYVNHFQDSGNLERIRIMKYLSPIIQDKKYEEILITTPDGHLIFSVQESYYIDSTIQSVLKSVIETRDVVVNNLYYCSTHHKIHHDVMAPVFDDNKIVAVLILRTDPCNFLFPYIQEWPIPSKTAETILVGKEGDSIIFLNDMKKLPNTALNYKLPLTDTIVPAVMAALGRKGIFKGRDYVGDKVLSDLGNISGTPWFLVVKVDTSELYNELYFKTIMIGIILLMAIFIISGAFIFNYYKKQTINQRLKEIDDHKLFAEKLKSQVAERTVELERSNQDLLSFAHVASHDLREPVRKIKTFLSLIKDDNNNDPQSRAMTYFSRIESSAERLESIIDGVLHYSRLQNTSLEMSMVDLNEIIDTILFDLELQISSKKAEFEINNLPVVEGSKIMLYQLFYNLINNSMKFTKPGEAAKVIIQSSSIVRKDEEYVEITVADNGVGFDPIYSQVIFESFKRLHSKDIYEGTGLGLALCKRIVHRHKGNISATGSPGTGAVFHILLPIRQNNQ